MSYLNEVEEGENHTHSQGQPPVIHLGKGTLKVCGQVIGTCSALELEKKFNEVVSDIVKESK